jgi:hypothetical protein
MIALQVKRVLLWFLNTRAIDEMQATNGYCSCYEILQKEY